MSGLYVGAAVESNRIAVAYHPDHGVQWMKILSKRQQDTYLKLIQELLLVSLRSEVHLNVP